MPVHHDRNSFEFLILDGEQAGLSWNTILRSERIIERHSDFVRIRNRILHGIADSGLEVIE